MSCDHALQPRRLIPVKVMVQRFQMRRNLLHLSIFVVHMCINSVYGLLEVHFIAFDSFKIQDLVRMLRNLLL